MNRITFSIPLQGKILIAVIIAVLLPLVIVAWLGFTSVSRISLSNIEAYIAESGARRQQAIENDFRNAFNEVNTFLDNSSNFNRVTEPLIVLERRGASAQSLELENEAERLFTNRLIASGLFNSVWLLNTRGRTMATAVSPNVGLGSTRIMQDTANTERFLLAGRQLIESGNNPQGLFVYDLGDNNQHMVLMYPLFAAIEEGGNTQLIGYMILDMNLNAIFVENLVQEVGLLDTYAFVILPDGNNYIASNDTIAQGLVNTNSIGANFSKTDAGSGVETYTIGTGDTAREVIGYHSSITINNNRFSLVAEINTAIVGQQLQSTLSTIVFPLVVGPVLLITLVILFTHQLINPALTRLRQAMQGVMRGNFEVPMTDGNRSDEIGALANTFTDMRAQVRALTEDMDNRLRARIRDVRVTQDISRTVTAERDLNRLMTQVVDLIVENFPSIYHAQIFLLDSAREYAVLRASTGEAGKGLLQRGHRLLVGSISVIGQVTEQARTIVARDIAESDVHRQNEFLRETQAELAIPLTLGGDIIGALDVQSKQRDSFDNDQITALQTLADQITIAIENARLYEESARLLSDLERDRRATTRYAWQQYVNAKRVAGIYARVGTNTGYEFDDIETAIYISGRSIVGDRTERGTIPFAVPIILRGETIGLVEYEVPESDFTQDKVMLAEELVSRLAISLDNARLFQDSQRTADRERIVNDISAKLTAQNDIEAIIQTAIKEVGQALRTPQIAVRLTNIGDQNNGHANGNGHSPQPDNPSRPDNE